MEKEFISEDLNYEYYKLNNHDYNDYLFMLNNYQISYLDKLKLNNNITFGIEIEYEGINEYIVDEFINENYGDWTSKDEKTIVKGGEIISPILYDSVNTWKDIKRICEFLKIHKAIVDNEAGAHIHIGTQILSNNIDKWQKFLLTYTAFEDTLYRFGSGERINNRLNQKVYAYPISIDLANKYDDLKNIRNIDDIKEIIDVEHRFQGLNPYNIDFDNIDHKTPKNTIEIRIPNGTKEEIIWQNNVNTFIHLLSVDPNDKQLEYINNEIEYIKDNYYNYEHYNYIDIKKAFLLADILFNNNLHKTNFLKQYIKDGKITEKTQPIYARKFIKN